MFDALKLKGLRQTSPRPFVVSAVYILLLIGLDSASRAFETFPNVSYLYLPAGLSLAFLLAYGLPYAAAVLLGHILVDLYISPLATDTIWILLQALGVTLVYLVAAAILRPTLGKVRIQLKLRNSFAALLLGGILVSIPLSGATVLTVAMSGLIPWNQVPFAFLDGSIGASIGIMSVTPFMVLHGIPFIESWVARLLGRSYGRRTGTVDVRSLLFTPVLLHFTVVVFIIWTMLMFPAEEQFLRFCLLTLPLIWVGLATGLEGVTAAIFALTLGFVLVLPRVGFEIEELTELQALLLVSSLNALLVGSAVTEGKLIKKTNAYRDAVLNSVSLAAEQLVGGENWSAGFTEVLRSVGKASTATRVYLLESRPGEEKAHFETTSFEWSSASILEDKHQHNMLNLLLTHHLDTQEETLSKGDVYHFHAQDMPEKEHKLFEALGIHSTVIVPIFVEQRIWGCLGFDRGPGEDEWAEPEIDALVAAARSLGTLLARTRTERQFRRLTGNIRAVFWISSPDGLKRTYVSPAYEQIWGRSRDKLKQRPESWMESVHYDDAPGVESALLRRGEFDKQYRIVLPDRSIRWIHDRGSAVRNELGQVSQIVGMAEDITVQKQVEDKIKETSTLLSTLIDNLKNGILVEDESLRIRYVNKAFCNLFDVPVPKESLLGTDSRLLFTRSKSLSENINRARSRGRLKTGEALDVGDLSLTRDYVPLSVSDEGKYHLWQYQNVTDQKRSEQQIRDSLKEKEVLLQEVHHRVKNNLQVICSLLNLQSAHIKDEQTLQIFADSQNRVRAMALVHERLYKSADLASVDFPGYAQNLTSHLMQTYRSQSTPVELKLELDPVPMNIDTAIPCGLIINELVSNSLKYAFPDQDPGEITIRFGQDDDGEITLQVRDNGVGLPQDFDMAQSPSLGLRLVRSLTEQLKGSLSYKNKEGSEFSIRFMGNGTVH